ncbi:MAG: hypothetical protein IJP33_01410, partial [Firmicutes bacterium]|nr:hypothetical protein [Bacillota bacterium]
ADSTNVEINWFEKKQLKKAAKTASDKKRLKGVRGLQGGLRGSQSPLAPCKNIYKIDSFVKITAETELKS